MKNPKKILIIAGEASGDLHGGEFMKAIMAEDPDVEFTGIGGPHMRSAGLSPIFGIEDFGFMGLRELIGHFSFLRKSLERIRSEINEEVSLVVLIDFPDFNFRVAQHAKNRGVPVFYYIAPQVWAWRKGRARAMRDFVDHIAVVFEFEVPIFEKAGVPVTFVGHPLLDLQRQPLSRKAFCDQAGLSVGDKLIGLLPGSRKQEVERILPIMLKTGSLLRMDNPSLRFLVSCAPSLDLEWVRETARPFAFDGVHILRDQTSSILHHAHAALVTSGTATLETAITGTPMVVLYATSGLTYALIRPFVRLPHISLVNIVAGEKVVDEFVQGQARPGRIAASIGRLVEESDSRVVQLQKLAGLRAQLGEPGAAKRTAALALQIAEY